MTRPTLPERSPTEVERINQASREYYERNIRRDFWDNKPFSDSRQAGWYLSAPIRQRNADIG